MCGGDLVMCLTCRQYSQLMQILTRSEHFKRHAAMRIKTHSSFFLTLTGVPGSPLPSSSTAESVSELTVLARADLLGDTAVFGWGEDWPDTETDTTLGDLEAFTSDIDLQERRGKQS